MKNTIKVLGIIALAAVIGFSFITCDNDTTTNDPPKSNTSPPLTGTVSISGTAEVGQTLTAVTTSLGGSGTISYQWKRSDGTAIGTNSDTYTVLNADVGFTITVTVTRVGSSGSVTSAPTATVISSLDDVPIKTKIADAENYKMQVEVNTDAATAVKNNDNATKNEVDTAVSTLTTATTVFNTAKTNNGLGILKGSYAATASNPYVKLTSPIPYQIVNLPSEGDLLKVVNPAGWAVVFCDISFYKNKNVTITFSAEVKRVGSAGNLFWQINNNDNPPIGTTINNAAVDTWHTMNVTWTGTPNDSDPKIYLSTYDNNSSTTTYYIRNFTIQVVQ